MGKRLRKIEYKHKRSKRGQKKDEINKQINNFNLLIANQNN